jgi:hypothetical protein
MKNIPYPWVLLKPISYRIVRPEIQTLYTEWGMIRNKLRTQIESKISQNLSPEQQSEIDQIKATIEDKVDEAMYNIATAQQFMANKSNNRQNRRQTVRRTAIPTTVFVLKATKNGTGQTPY